MFCGKSPKRITFEKRKPMRGAVRTVFRTAKIETETLICSTKTLLYNGLRLTSKKTAVVPDDDSISWHGSARLAFIRWSDGLCLPASDFPGKKGRNIETDIFLCPLKIFSPPSFSSHNCRFYPFLAFQDQWKQQASKESRIIYCIYWCILF